VLFLVEIQAFPPVLLGRGPEQEAGKEAALEVVCLGIADKPVNGARGKYRRRGVVDFFLTASLGLAGIVVAVVELGHQLFESEVVFAPKALEHRAELIDGYDT